MTHEIRKAGSFGLVLRTSSKAEAEKLYLKLRGSVLWYQIPREKN